LYLALETLASMDERKDEPRSEMDPIDTLCHYTDAEAALDHIIRAWASCG
jgi:hypothetical protein